MEQGLLCWNCGKPTGITDKVMRSDHCDKCLADLRCCRGCRHFDPTRRFQCKESIEHQVVNKEKSNMCDFYQHREVTKVSGGMKSKISDKDNLKNKFDDLFDD
ncbi:MAG: hypothetical protein U9N54_10945 [candidate division Zixibacteria bacterium]|nr:hypothetical protein [candidate division Zixibacteria bacterium]